MQNLSSVFVAILLPFATVPHGQLRNAAARCVAARATPGEAALGFAESGTGTASKGAAVIPKLCKSAFPSTFQVPRVRKFKNSRHFF